MSVKMALSDVITSVPTQLEGTNAAVMMVIIYTQMDIHVWVSTSKAFVISEQSQIIL